jgi:hypothetical protein
MFEQTLKTFRILYIESKRSGTSNTYQAIVFPPLERTTVAGVQKKRSGVLWRSISTTHPRKKWRFMGNSQKHTEGTAANSYEAFASVRGPVKEYAELIRRYAPKYATEYSWGLVEKPLVVELSEEDIQNYFDKKTPNALIRRIMKARSTANYPELLSIKEVVPSPRGEV